MVVCGRFVRYFGCWLDGDGHLYTQLEYLEGVSLAKRKQSRLGLLEPECLHVVLQVTPAGLVYFQARVLVTAAGTLGGRGAAALTHARARTSWIVVTLRVCHRANTGQRFARCCPFS